VVQPGRDTLRDLSDVGAELISEARCGSGEFASEGLLDTGESVEFASHCRRGGGQQRGGLVDTLREGACSFGEICTTSCLCVQPREDVLQRAGRLGEIT